MCYDITYISYIHIQILKSEIILKYTGQKKVDSTINKTKRYHFHCVYQKSLKWEQLRMSNTPEQQNEKQHRVKVERSQFVR